MLGRIFAILLIVLGLGTAAAGIGSGTVWRPDETVTATLPQEPEAPVVLARTHVLATVNPDVQVRLTGADADTPLVLVMGRTAEVRAWLDGADALEITGLSSWETLRVEESAPAEPSESPSEEPADEEAAEDATSTVPDPAGSDLWIEELTGTGELTYEWSQVEGDWTMMVATDGTAPAPSVALTWDREVTTPLMVPGIVVGSVLFLIGAVWLTVLLLMAREEKRARSRSAESGEGEDATIVLPAASLTGPDGAPLTRRQLREAERTQVIRKDDSDSEQPETEQSDQDGAGDLDSWVRSGRPTDDEAEQPDQPDSAPDTAEPAQVETARRRWWQRRGPAEMTTPSSDEESAGASLRDPSSWGTPTIGAGASGTPHEPDQVDEPDRPTGPDSPNAQASGASWRQTWGLGLSRRIGDPADPADPPESEEER
ncbi:hypothetical protein LQF12_11360 [Ruania suaedae]|uniref:hypothetical protein n=1 Tax=Ruania suaedae TaxID=2897774 RepID=UPI001E4ED97D|nr:hypothetical protein [Ruania suaedae]UFU02107.1 hypothetical protein LQF12_11360 [Ruania suaedae]